MRHQMLDLPCLDLRVLPCYSFIAVATILAMHDFRGFWGIGLRAMGVLAQFLFAAGLSLFVIEPLRIQFGPYRGGVCGDL